MGASWTSQRCQVLSLLLYQIETCCREKQMTDASLQISQLPQDLQMVPMPKIPKDGGIMWNPIEYMQLVGYCFGKSRVSDMEMRRSQGNLAGQPIWRLEIQNWGQFSESGS